MKYILSRLGKSINKIDYMLTQVGFEFLTIQNLLDSYLLSDDLSSAEELLEEAQNSPDYIEPAYQQYFGKVHCVILQKRGTSPSTLIKELLRTLHITLPSFSLETIEKYLLAEDEWLLLFMLLEQILKSGDASASPHIHSIYHYFNTLEFDQEAWIMLYPKISWLYMQVCQSVDERISVCEKVLLALRENTRLLHMDCFAKAKCDLYKEKYGETHSSYLHTQRQYDALLWVYEDAGRSASTEPEMWFSVNNPEIYLLPEVVRSERQVHHLSQERAGDKFDIDQKTFSRIENGLNTPKPGTLAKIKETLGIYRGIHNTLLVVNDFEDLELERQLTCAISSHEYSKAQAILDELKPKLSMSHKENQQYVDYTQTSLNYKSGLISPFEALAQCKQAFEITRPYDEKLFNRLVLSRLECLIIHFMSSIYMELDEIDHSTKLLESILLGFSCSKINQKFHYRELSIILLSLSYGLNYSKKPHKAMDYCIQGLALQFDFYRSNLIHYFLTQKYYILESNKISNSQLHDAYKNIFFAEYIFTNKYDHNLAKYFYTLFCENIND